MLNYISANMITNNYASRFVADIDDTRSDLDRFI